MGLMGHIVVLYFFYERERERERDGGGAEGAKENL